MLNLMKKIKTTLAKELYDEGQKHLEEKQYEQASISFKKALECNFSDELKADILYGLVNIKFETR